MTEGYKIINKSSQKGEYDSSAVTKVYKLKREGKKVDIIFTDRASVIVPILRYHLTVIRNYVTVCSLVYLYS